MEDLNKAYRGQTTSRQIKEIDYLKEKRILDTTLPNGWFSVYLLFMVHLFYSHLFGCLFLLLKQQMNLIKTSMVGQNNSMGLTLLKF